ncbi:YkyA family protein [Staphylococcus agnetis]|uniref:YkyA family protein n=1 Tax=Staphylococcus agnetis TaxID=985762 RepID=UPI000D029F50|nr:YkyA family protein [Staphylococcus agnetis]
MKIKKTIGVVLATTVLLAACNNDKEHIQNVNDGLEKMQKAEQPLEQINQNRNKLEQEKEKITKGFTGKNPAALQDDLKKVLKNTEERNKTIKQEENAVKNSKKEFEKVKSEVNKIEDKDKKKQYDEFVKALDTKYQNHADFTKGYQDLVNKEKDLFTFFSGQSGTQDEVDKKSKSIVEAQKQLKNKVDKYAKSLRNVQKEKRDIDEISNS